MRIKVLRAFRVGDKVYKPDTEVNIEDNYAREVLGSNKAVRVDPDQEPSGPMRVQSAKKGGGENAG